MNIVVFKHFSFDDESVITSWAERQGHSLQVLVPSGLKEFPDPSMLHMLLILGGPMSVYQEAQYPWLIQEKKFVKACIDAGKSILGICLGAQMLSEVLGGTVSRHTHKEIGWHTVDRTEERHPVFEGIPESFISFQWHGDTFSLPEGAKKLAGSGACSNQAFAYGDHVVGLQFHLETTPACMDTMVNVWSEELADAPFIQTASAITAQRERSRQSHAMLTTILDHLAALRPQAPSERSRTHVHHGQTLKAAEGLT